MIPPVYYNSLQYALKNHEPNAYLISLNSNIICSKEISLGFQRYFDFDSWKLNSKALALEIIHQFGMERVKFVLANTISHTLTDSRISEENRMWASTIPAADDDRTSDYLVQASNPGLLNLLVSEIRAFETPQKSHKIQKTSTNK